MPNGVSFIAGPWSPISRGSQAIRASRAMRVLKVRPQIRPTSKFASPKKNLMADTARSEPLSIEPLYTSAAIGARLDGLAHEIAGAMPRDFCAIAILKGSFIFAADLIRALTARGLNPEVDFMTLASYGAGTSSSGTVSLLRDAEIEVHGREVLLIDDIL